MSDCGSTPSIKMTVKCMSELFSMFARPYIEHPPLRLRVSQFMVPTRPVPSQVGQAA